MNERFDMRFFNRLLKIGGTLLVIAVVTFVFGQIGVLATLKNLLVALLPVLFAISLAYLLEPVIKLLIRWKIKRPLAVIIIYTILGGILYLVLYFVVPGIISQLLEFFNALPTIIESVNDLVASVGAPLGVNIDVETLFESFLTDITSSIIGHLKNALSFVMVVAIALTGSVLLSFDFVDFKEKVRKVVRYKADSKIYRFFSRLLPNIHRYAVGLIIDNFLLFIIASVVFFFAGAKYPILFGLIVAITNFIPLIGQFIGGTPIVLIGFATSLEQGIIFLVIIVVLQFFESNVIQPLMLRQVLKIRPIENLIAVTLAGALLGVLGMILAPFFVIAVKIIWQIMVPGDDVSGSLTGSEKKD